MKNIAVLLTCFNRKNKTLACLQSLFNTDFPKSTNLDVFLVDDGSTDGTSEAIKQAFPSVNIIQGTGSLFWAGGMRLAWNTAVKKSAYDAFLLLNDDTILYKTAITDLINAHYYSSEKYKKAGIYIGSTQDPTTKEFTYGGKRLNAKHTKIIPTESYQLADLANANILMVSHSVYSNIGGFNTKYTHGIADYDYTLMATKKNFPLIVCPQYQGVCENEHGDNWKSAKSSLKERLTYLYSPIGLAFKDYTYYIKKHFGFKAYIIAIVKLYGKTFFPVFWDKLKK